jgi:hypothetical protein
MKKRQALLSEEQWAVLIPLFPEPRRRKDGRGRPWASNRACLQGILWILRTGARWRDLPDIVARRFHLAAVADVGRAGRLAAGLAEAAGADGRARVVGLGGGIS